MNEHQLAKQYLNDAMKALRNAQCEMDNARRALGMAAQGSFGLSEINRLSALNKKIESMKARLIRHGAPHVR